MGKFNRELARHEGEQAPVEVRFPAKLFIVLIGRGAVLSEGEIGMTEKFLGDRRLLCRIDDLCFETGNPLHPGFLRARELNSTLDRPRAFHGAVDFIEPVWIGHQRENRFVRAVRQRQRIKRGPEKGHRDSEKR